MAKWKKETKYGEIVGATLNTEKLQISIHRHAHYEPDLWLLSCNGMISRRKLKSKDLDEAKCQGLAIIQVMLEAEIETILSTNT